MGVAKMVDLYHLKKLYLWFMGHPQKIYVVVNKVQIIAIWYANMFLDNCIDAHENNLNLNCWSEGSNLIGLMDDMHMAPEDNICCLEYGLYDNNSTPIFAKLYGLYSEQYWPFISLWMTWLLVL